MVKLFRQTKSITFISAVLSIYTLLAYHYPLFSVIIENLEGGFNSVIITAGFAVLMLAANFFFYNLILYLTRSVGKWVVAFTLVGDAIMLYFVNTYDVLVTDSMMGNVFNTKYSEASGFFSVAAIFYVLLLGVIPAAILLLQQIDYKSPKRFGVNTGLAIATMAAMVAININNFTWIDRHATKLGSLLMPWSYTVNSIRYYNAERKRNQKEILLPDATIANNNKEVVVLIIGESARKENFSLYGYDKQTNPLLENQAVTTLNAKSAATYTTAGVKAILDHKPTDKLYEILPNYLYRAGVDVVWRTANWGEPPVHIEKYQKVADLKAQYPDADDRYDGILTVGLKEIVENSSADKVLIILHTSTSHGPTYFSKYPSEFERFTPVCTTVEMAKAVHSELINAYDNTILYTDYLINEVIESMKSLTSHRSCVIFISDHGESLGENNLYMHGVPMAMAPKEQVEIPFIVWTSDNSAIKSIDEAGQYHIFHSTMDFLSIESPVFDSQKTIFE